MDEASELNTPRPAWQKWLAALRPALPAVIGAAALSFLFAAVIPMAWIAGISWNLYLDRLSDLFVPPVGNAARLVLAVGMAAIAALLAGFIALLIARPEESGLGALRRRIRRAVPEDADDDALPRRRADLHPDDLPRPPIRAGRDLPVEGLGPVVPLASTWVPDEPSPPADMAIAVQPDDGDGAAEASIEAADHGTDMGGEDELILADLAPEESVAGEEPWLQPVEYGGPARPDPADASLGAMVARFEAGLSRRREWRAATATVPVPGATPADGEGDGEIDFALEAALGTLQRMNRNAAN
ncbi:MAG: hypothetical protein DI569_04120 [Sphingopyxis macrogoltabida]|uniref:Uncharacterized protein n=1 Tax=Sphingopyxis macrogoltabida TaxID=33050 RepID=A0A2W5L2Q7_SPHMC|nr:MAG: hypothetical protein DI569_04120 [Sphingopyxis macrogoltabida]